MHQAPEGLAYGHYNDKYAKADKLEEILEKGKFDTGRPGEHESAEAMRMLGQGSHDPCYEHAKKNR